MKMTDESVPAAEATVWTILFSWMVMPLKPRRTAMEMTAAGMEVEKVNPALRPKNTLAAVKTSVISTPRTMPRTVSSVGSADVELMRCAPPKILLARLSTTEAGYCNARAVLVSNLKASRKATNTNMLLVDPRYS